MSERDYWQGFALGADDDDFGDVPNREIVTSAGELVELHPLVAIVRNRVLDDRAADRLAYCERHGIDPERFTGCHACEGTGYNPRNHMPCFCRQGISSLRHIEKTERQQSAEIARLATMPPSTVNK